MLSNLIRIPNDYSKYTQLPKRHFSTGEICSDVTSLKVDVTDLRCLLMLWELECMDQNTLRSFAKLASCHYPTNQWRNHIVMNPAAKFLCGL